MTAASAKTDHPPLIPVIDIMGGVVVRGIAGQRESYQPLQSQLVSTADPVAVAAALIGHFSPEWIYVADLDGLQYQRPSWETLQRLAQLNVSLCVDAGTWHVEEIRQLLNLGVQRVVLALETLADLDQLRDLVNTMGEEQLMFSLDLNNGVPWNSIWKDQQPLEIADAVLQCGIEQMIVLDLHAVGGYQGIPTLELCHQIRALNASVTLWTGGGIRSVADMTGCQAVDGLLVASALHDGRISPNSL